MTTESSLLQNDVPKPLDVAGMPLRGRHLIEASAGTGKTYNITRLYLRLLLEKKLNVQQILVMTFTKAATEEIRGRIAETLRHALSFWQAVVNGEQEILAAAEPVYRSLYEQLEPQEAIANLQVALLELDDAAVFTIHGFCNKVLSQLAFASGSPMERSLATDIQPLYLQAAQDWVRLVGQSEQDFEALYTRGWHDPEALLRQFGAAIRSPLVPRVPDHQEIEADAQAQIAAAESEFGGEFRTIRDQLLNAETQVLAALVHKKPKEAAQRQQEWEILLQWLNESALSLPPAEIGRFINGNRYRGNEELKALFAPLKGLMAEVKKQLESAQQSMLQRLDSLNAYQLVANGFEYIREHVSRNKQRQGVMDFDDLISSLAHQLSSGEPQLREQLQALYPVALIDEFQDTDNHQYEILSHLYPKDNQELVLMMIGDPKQAIYGFRGGDIFTYLEASRQADYRWVMDTNWRSVAPMVEAYNRLFYGTAPEAPPRDVFGFGIGYEPVLSTASAKAANTPLKDPDVSRRALNYVCLPFEGEAADAAKDQMQRALGQWLCNEIQRLLSEATLGDKPVQPADIAILVRSAPEAMLLQQQLARAGLGAVFLSNKSNLFSSPEAEDVFRVLDGIWHWEERRRLSACLSSPLLGLSHQQLVDLLHHEDDGQWEATMGQIYDLRQIWLQKGPMTLMLQLLQRHYSATGGEVERQLTNYLHLAEVLQRFAEGQPQPQQLLVWLNQQMQDPAQGEEQIQRLESDARLIQLITQHGSKGLEYPIVFVPFASDYRDPAKAGNQWLHHYKYYDPHRNSLTLQLGPGHLAIQNTRQEGEAEAVRLLYVAVTRAAHRCYLGIAPFKQHHRSALAHALGVSSETDWSATLARVCEEAGQHSGVISVDEVQIGGAVRSPQANSFTLSLASFTGSVEENWRLYSFTALTRLQTVVKQNRREAELPVVPEAEPIQPLSAVAPAEFRFVFEKGASAGNLLHDLLEDADFDAPDWVASGTEHCRRFGLAEESQPALYGWLNEVLATPLGHSTHADLTLGALPRGKTLREAEFYFPLQSVDWSQLANILQHHRLEVGADAQTVPALSSQALEGMMHGFIDLIFEFNGRFYVADYKSTYLGDNRSDYNYPALVQNNQAHQYDLQYLIYALALHRYLSVSLEHYSADEHFGGVFYLYLRGMHPDNPEPHGVFFTELTTSLLEQLDAVFAGKIPEGQV
ncbi:exodeoxyribonuclease V subunit beta [Alteromonas aestuariivivens]|uniref:RecBCD enzyme subunit RecB n=1 Tax=Alteromonas aestuariivivens TaxID=1938339 RepID=A0A3D8M456_9ALTE|nr:exodeoxyribonuclease V subunit beta [Alteromonas aestuariivivens]RDV24469.1 exodeoxyribonuclease V subunit beta [Alteromonas aestuariivivens]